MRIWTQAIQIQIPDSDYQNHTVFSRSQGNKKTRIKFFHKNQNMDKLITQKQTNMFKDSVSYCSYLEQNHVEMYHVNNVLTLYCIPVKKNFFCLMGTLSVFSIDNQNKLISVNQLGS